MSGFTFPGTRFVWLFYWGLSGLADPAASYTTVSRVPSFNRFFFIPKSLNWLWLSPSFLVNGCLRHFPGMKRGRGLKLTTSIYFPGYEWVRSLLPHPHIRYMTPRSVQLGRQYSKLQQMSLTSLHRFPVRRRYWELRLSEAKWVWCWLRIFLCEVHNREALLPPCYRTVSFV